MAEKKRPKAESFFQTKALDISASDDEMARPKKPEQAIKVLVVWPGLEGPAGQPCMASSGPGRPWCLGGSAGFCRHPGH